MLSRQLSTTRSKTHRRSFRRLFKKSRKRIIRYGLLTANLALLVAVVSFIARSPASSTAVSRGVLNNANNGEIANPLDQLSSADIAVHVAKLVNLDETRSVANNADTVNAQLAITPADDKVVAKPQVIATAQKSRRDIKAYIVQAGDTISSIASKFGVTSDSIRWSNGLTGDAVAAGKELTIPPITGIVYVVKAGDTPESLADRYRVNKDQIIFFNDAEVGGLPVGQKIVIPDATPPVTRTAVVSTGFAWGGYAAMYGSNGYEYGWCTWWAAARREQMGIPLPNNLGNAVTWKYLAQRAGLPVSRTPKAGAVAYYEAIGGLGHVGFVEQVNPDGSAWISDMNYYGVSEIGGSTPAGGWGRRSFHLVQAGEMGSYSFIY